MQISLTMVSFLLLISTAHGIFFTILTAGKLRRSSSARILFVIFILLILANAEYLFIASGAYTAFSHFFGISNGFMLLFGPLMWLYSRSLTDAEFEISKIQSLHCVPYLLFCGVSWPLWFLDHQAKVAFIEVFISGHLPLRVIDYVIFVLQVIHFTTYMLLSLRSVRIEKQQLLDRMYQEDITGRLKWIKFLIGFFCAYLILVSGLVIQVFYSGVFSPDANYAYTLALSAIMYFAMYYGFNNPDAVTGGFTQKYKNVVLSSEEMSEYTEAIRSAFDDEKMYLQPDLKLADVAKKINASPHLVSQLINQHYGHNFFDHINTLRIAEFKRRLAQPDVNTMTLLGIALESGFNSKSTFNAVFKKFEGITPLEYKKNLNKPQN